MLQSDVFGNLSNLNYLAFYNNAITMLPLGIFGNLSNLLILKLSNNAITMLPSGIFGNLSNLAAIALRRSRHGVRRHFAAAATNCAASVSVTVGATPTSSVSAYTAVALGGGEGGKKCQRLCSKGYKER